MTRGELCAALRARFKEIHGKHRPEIAAACDTLSDYSVLVSNSRCGACHEFHNTTDELVKLAEHSATFQDWLEASEALAIERFPKECIERLRGTLEALQAEQESN